MLVDVVVLTWNDGPLLEVAVRSALNSADLDVRVYVVDNGSEPPAVVPRDERVELLRNDTNRGVAPGRNQGIDAGSAPLVCLLDSDAELGRWALSRLVRWIQDDVGMAVPVFDDQRPEDSAGAAPTLLRKLERVSGLRSDYATTARVSEDSAWDVDFGIGACQVFRRDTWEAVGGLDESYFYGPEDVDFCLRLREAGWRVVQVGNAAVRHPPRRRNRRLLTRRGLLHAKAVIRHLWRHRHFRRLTGSLRT